MRRVEPTDPEITKGRVVVRGGVAAMNPLDERAQIERRRVEAEEEGLAVEPLVDELLSRWYSGKHA